MKKQVIFEAIINESGILCIRIPELDPVIGAEGELAWVPADMGKGFWKKAIRVLRQECDKRFIWRSGEKVYRRASSECELRRVAIIKEKIELIEKGLRRGTNLFPKRRS